MSLGSAHTGDSSLQPAWRKENDQSVQLLNSFLRSELAAGETYRAAIDKLVYCRGQIQANIGLLREIGTEHRIEAQVIGGRIHDMGGAPADQPAEDENESGVAWMKFALSAASVYGWSAVLRNLKEEEERQLKALRDGLNNLDAESGQLIEDRLIPAQLRHVTLLDQLIDGAESDLG